MDFLRSLDGAALEWFQDHHTPWGNAIMIDVTAMGGHVVLVLVVLFTLGLLLALRRRQTAIFVFLAVAGGAVLVEVIKLLIGRHRPSIEIPPPLASLPSSSSFPSGHSMLSATVYLTLALLIAGRLQGRRTRAYVIGWSLLLTFFVGVSRLYLGVHYLTDVVGGWIFGLAWALIWRWIEDHWVRFRERAVDLGGENGGNGDP
jgi:undecaprenyl-diphosphatase